MENRRPPSRMSAADVARTTFTPVRRGGVDGEEVRRHLENVAREMGRLETRLEELTERLSAAERRAANPVIDEKSLSAALGEQSAAILHAAHEEAAAVTAEVQKRAEVLFAESQARSAQHLIDARERATALVSDAEAEVERLENDAREAAQRLIDSANKNADALIENAREKGRAIVEQSHEARRSVLNDLALKRKALHLQVDQLRAARDVLSAHVSTLRGTIESAFGDLLMSDEAAKAAALDVLKSRTVVEPSEEELLAGTPLRAVADVEVTHEAANTEEVTTRPRRVKPPVATPTPSPELLEDDPTATDVVNDIFARLRASTLEERGASERAKPTVRQKTNAPDDAVFGRRDDAIEEALALTIKRVKRALQDDQNSVLEALRDVGGLITTELGDEAEQRARFATAIDEGLRACALAGARFAKAEGAASDQPPSESALSDVAADFSYQIVNALRRKILTEGGGSATERANEAYREWRGARVERLCTQEARRAFHLGVVAACAGGNVLFLAAPYDTPCDACDMDAKAGPRPAGTAFPSGTPFPPGHAGCACTIVPA